MKKIIILAEIAAVLAKAQEAKSASARTKLREQAVVLLSRLSRSPSGISRAGPRLRLGEFPLPRLARAQ
jgi:hypothetical protein